MGAYRCLNCGITSNTADFECHLEGCGFRVGRFEYDSEAGSSGSSLGDEAISCIFWWVLIVGGTFLGGYVLFGGR